MDFSSLILVLESEGHECIGIGSLGIDTIKSIINHEKLRNLPFYLETPQKDLNGYAEEISLLKGLYEK